jgi:ribosome-binding factor A
MRRVDESLLEVIAGEVTRLKDPGLGFVTITGVATSPDLRNARVFYSVIGDDDQQERTQAALERAAPRLQGVVGREVRLKYNPRLAFVFDESIEQGLRIDRLLHEIADEQDRTEGGDDDDS